MHELPIVPHGDAAALVLPAAVLESLGFRVGDVVEVALVDRQLILRSAEDASRHQLLEKITQEVFDQRRDAYQRLA